MALTKEDSDGEGEGLTFVELTEDAQIAIVRFLDPVSWAALFPTCQSVYGNIGTVSVVESAYKAQWGVLPTPVARIRQPTPLRHVGGLLNDWQKRYASNIPAGHLAPLFDSAEIETQMTDNGYQFRDRYHFPSRNTLEMLHEHCLMEGDTPFTLDGIATAVRIPTESEKGKDGKPTMEFAERLGWDWLLDAWEGCGNEEEEDEEIFLYRTDDAARRDPVGLPVGDLVHPEEVFPEFVEKGGGFSRAVGFNGHSLKLGGSIGVKEFEKPLEVSPPNGRGYFTIREVLRFLALGDALARLSAAKRAQTEYIAEIDHELRGIETDSEGVVRLRWGVWEGGAEHDQDGAGEDENDGGEMEEENEEEDIPVSDDAMSNQEDQGEAEGGAETQEGGEGLLALPPIPEGGTEPEAASDFASAEARMAESARRVQDFVRRWIARNVRGRRLRDAATQDDDETTLPLPSPQDVGNIEGLRNDRERPSVSQGAAGEAVLRDRQAFLSSETPSVPPTADRDSSASLPSLEGSSPSNASPSGVVAPREAEGGAVMVSSGTNTTVGSEAGDVGGEREKENVFVEGGEGVMGAQARRAFASDGAVQTESSEETQRGQ
uniref:Uncharacterized protein n=1 Tax=Chromera velia CCMP2878 TaxID=1169474 RepID=A0A0G4ICH0_9ALVE|eukprot:Cvel_13115.t1-p1 / transcript=Cvel_13115.t1 / gene=Cvel_13115 / organism=Chromera_velia_CCMP2878 / gene_product=hypothetical protein / transcript_product=hypothetical protein / location=Cvel_scaffold884:10446-12588(-) / protein_length=602 / sequence_SO=supercontig / SO=protein_coding / is_pseudo=false